MAKCGAFIKGRGTHQGEDILTGLKKRHREHSTYSICKNCCFAKLQGDRQCMCKVTLRRVRRAIVTVEKQWVLSNLCVCIYSLRYAACNAACTMLSAQFYNIRFWEKKLFDIKCVFWASLQLLSETFFILRRNEPDMIKNVCWYSFEVPFGLVRFSWNSDSFGIFSKNTQISNFMKIRPVGAGLFHPDRRGEANNRFSQFCEST